MTRRKFPTFPVDGRAKALYMRAFGEERYKQYQSCVNGSPKTKTVEKVVEVRHKGFHDVESFAWILFHELLIAWPKKSRSDELTEDTIDILDSIDTHDFGSHDKRLPLFNASEDL